MRLDLQQGLELYRRIVLIRRFEERVSERFQAGAIPGFIHLCIGQEATAVGGCVLLRPDDYLVSNHRGHGHCLAKGADPGRMLAELYGRRDGYCRGRGGSMHIGAAEVGVLGTNGIVGAGLPIATGAALTARLAGRGQVAICYFGEGAVGTGAFHEAVNMAAVLELPVIFFCENNGYAEFTPQRLHSKVARVADRAAGYGIPGVTVDGNDLLAVLDAMADAVERARSGGGPTLVEGVTYRWHGHYEGDPQDYRTSAELAAWQERDPLPRFRRWLLAEGGAAESDVARQEAAAAAQVDAAHAFAEASPFPDPSELDADADLYAAETEV